MRPAVAHALMGAGAATRVGAARGVCTAHGSARDGSVSKLFDGDSVGASRGGPAGPAVERALVRAGAATRVGVARGASGTVGSARVASLAGTSAGATGLALLLLAATPLLAQDGATIFRQSCAVGYCHGTGGAAGRAPALLDRAFTAAQVMKVVRDGIPNTGMPGWKDRLNSEELNAVVSYVVKLSGGTGTATATASAAAAIPEGARRGRDLFFDAVRGTRCSTCHLVESKGIPVGPNLVAGAAPDVDLIRSGKPATVRLARLTGGDAFPALLVEQKAQWLKLYDLTIAPPVMRTVARDTVSWSGEHGWRHAEATSNYSDTELASVAEYLRWLTTR